MTSPVVDIYLVYEFLKRLVTPFDQTQAFKLGLIDASGKRLKKAESTQEKEAMGYFDRLVFNLKRLLGKFPAGQTQIASYAAALLLLKEEQHPSKIGDDPINLQKELFETIQMLSEDAPVNATGAAVAGTGDNQVHWKRPANRKRMGKPIDGVLFLRRKRYEQLRKLNSEEVEKTYYKMLNKKVPAASKSSSAGGPSSDADEACWTGYKQVGMKKKGNRNVPNCVPVNEVLKQVDGKWALVSKTTGKPLAYYNGEGKPSDDWIARQERRIQFFKHKG